MIMKSIRKQLKPISLFMAFLVLFVSCEQYDDDIFNDSIKTNQVTGKELFKSIFFGYGSIGGQISILEKKSSSIKRFSKEETQEFGFTKARKSFFIFNRTF